MPSKPPPPKCDTCDSRHQSILCDLPDKELERIQTRKTCNHYKKGQTIFYEGNRPAGVYCIESGKIKIFKTGIDGKEQIVRLAKAGELLGYRSLISEEAYSASAMVLEDSVICFLDSREFFDLLGHDANFSIRLIRELSIQLGVAENRIRDLAQKPVRERLAETLLFLEKKYGIDRISQGALNVQLTREEMANIVGTATETVIRILSEFKNEGLVDLQKRRIVLMNRDKLTEIANLNY